jgi:hypothetical protein
MLFYMFLLNLHDFSENSNKSKIVVTFCNAVLLQVINTIKVYVGFVIDDGENYPQVAANGSCACVLSGIRYRPRLF